MILFVNKEEGKIEQIYLETKSQRIFDCKEFEEFSRVQILFYRNV